MANYSLAQRGSKAITSSDTSPIDVTLGTPIKLGSSHFNALVRDRRKNVSVQRGTVTLSSGGTSPNDVTITAVDLACSFCKITVRENRAAVAAGAVGVSAKLTSTTNLRLSFYGAIAGGENIEIEWEVIEAKPYRMATARLVDVDKVRITWDGTLATGETIDVDWEVWDADDIGDDLLEILFREQRILAYLGENLVTDWLQYDDAGNVVSCRLRIFDTRAHAEAATFDLPAGSPLEDGELSRAMMEQDIDKSTNNRISLVRVLDQVIDTPGVD